MVFNNNNNNIIVKNTSLYKTNRFYGYIVYAHYTIVQDTQVLLKCRFSNFWQKKVECLSDSSCVAAASHFLVFPKTIRHWRRRRDRVSPSTVHFTTTACHGATVTAVVASTTTHTRGSGLCWGKEWGVIAAGRGPTGVIIVTPTVTLYWYNGVARRGVPCTRSI